MAYDKAKRNATLKRYQDKSQTRYMLVLHNEKYKDIISFIEEKKKVKALYKY